MICLTRIKIQPSKYTVKWVNFNIASVYVVNNGSGNDGVNLTCIPFDVVTGDVIIDRVFDVNNFLIHPHREPTEDLNDVSYKIFEHLWKPFPRRQMSTEIVYDISQVLHPLMYTPDIFSSNLKTMSYTGPTKRQQEEDVIARIEMSDVSN